MKISLQHIPKSTFEYQNQNIINFGGTNYLAITGHEVFQKNLLLGIETCGLAWGSSPVSPLQISIYHTFEIQLAGWFKAEACTIVSSGMWAGQLLHQVLKSHFQNAFNIFAPMVHPALWGDDFVNENLSWAEFEESICQKVVNAPSEQVHIFVDAVSTPVVRKITFDWLKNLNSIGKKIRLIVDESHSIGVLGYKGCGVIDNLHQFCTNIEIIRIASLNKALGISGGIILSDLSIKKAIFSYPLFIGASRPSPAIMFAGNASFELYQSQLIQLKQNLEYFWSINAEIRPYLNVIENHPAFEIKIPLAMNELLENQMFMPIFSYPNPSDEPVARLVICANHTFEQIDKVVQFLTQKIKNEAKV